MSRKATTARQPISQETHDWIRGRGRKARLSVDLEQAGCLEDALSYYLEASRNNFGGGYGSEDADDARQLLHERARVAEFLERITAARNRMAGGREKVRSENDATS